MVPARTLLFIRYFKTHIIKNNIGAVVAWLESQTGGNPKVTGSSLNTRRKWQARHLTKMAADCSGFVCPRFAVYVLCYSLLLMCTNLNRLNAEDKFQVWVTILGLNIMSLSLENPPIFQTALSSTGSQRCWSLSQHLGPQVRNILNGWPVYHRHSKSLYLRLRTNSSTLLLRL